MPNYCENNLKIVGTPQQLRSFRQRFLYQQNNRDDIDEDFSFNSIIPKPAFNNNQNGMQSYDWCNANWGTKWDASDVNVHINDNSIEIDFLTAWTPPSEDLLLKLSELIPNTYIKLLYEEPGCNFCGYYKFLNNQILIQEQDDLASQEFIQHQEELQSLIDEAEANEESISDLEEPYEENPENPWVQDFNNDADCPLIRINKRKSQKFNKNIKCRVKLDKYDRITLITKVRQLGLAYTVGMSKKRALSIIQQYYIKQMLKTVECSICNDNIVNPIATKCPIQHLFCLKCATKWVTIKNSCPICRQLNAF